MDIEEVLENLCVHDPRSPYFKDLHGYNEPDEIPKPRENCSCDFCFRGKDKLALEILRLRGYQ